MTTLDDEARNTILDMNWKMYLRDPKFVQTRNGDVLRMTMGRVDQLLTIPRRDRPSNVVDVPTAKLKQVRQTITSELRRREGHEFD